MNEPEKNTKPQPLDLTSDEAAEFLFGKEVVDELKKVANPIKQRVSDSDEDCENQPYTQDSK